MPPHIVLPNGMWRFVKKGAKSITKRVSNKRVKTRKKRIYRGAVSMVRRRGRGSHRKSMFGGSKLTNGMFKPTGILGTATTAVGSATIINQLLGGEKFAYQSEAVGFVTGGIVGAGSVFALKKLPSLAGGSSSGQTMY